MANTRSVFTGRVSGNRETGRLLFEEVWMKSRENRVVAEGDRRDH